MCELSKCVKSKWKTERDIEFEHNEHNSSVWEVCHPFNKGKNCSDKRNGHLVLFKLAFILYLVLKKTFLIGEGIKKNF